MTWVTTQLGHLGHQGASGMGPREECCGLLLGNSLVLLFLLFLENPKSQIDKPRRIFLFVKQSPMIQCLVLG